MRQTLLLFVNKLFLVLIAMQSLHHSGYAQRKIKVACIGNSITYGAYIDHREQNSYPAQLQAMLGNDYEVTNYGVSGTTLLHKGNIPYRGTGQYSKALASNPDIVCIMLGTNDSKLINRVHMDDFEQDYKELIQSFSPAGSHRRIILLTPVPSFSPDTTEIWNDVILKSIIPAIEQVAYTRSLELLDIYHLLIDKPQLFSDKVHPAAEGATIIAKRIYEAILPQKHSKMALFNKIKAAKVYSSFYGYECADFQFDGRACKIVEPKWVAKGKPWVWRARFWGHEPQADIALLERGFHIVYCDVAELYGNVEAIRYWNDFYKLMYKAGMAKKVVLEGMSRGGVYVYNWAAVNPRKVACIYADNPVLDLKSWPGGKGKGPGDKDNWEIFKKDYGYGSDSEAMKFTGSPIDKVVAIVNGGYPMLHVCGDADEVVPMEENTTLFETKVKALKGDITVIHKKGFGHHPHSLPDPTPIVNFILKSLGK